MENLFFWRDLFADVMSVQNRNMKHGGGPLFSFFFFFFHILDPVDGNFADECLILKEKTYRIYLCPTSCLHCCEKFIFFRNGTSENNSVQNGILEKVTREMVL